MVRYGTIYWPSALLTLAAPWSSASSPRCPRSAAATWASARHPPARSARAGGGVFLVLAPRLTGARVRWSRRILIAPYAVLAGLAGSAITVAIGRRMAAADAGRHDWSTLANAADGTAGRGRSRRRAGERAGATQSERCDRTGRCGPTSASADGRATTRVPAGRRDQSAAGRR